MIIITSFIIILFISNFRLNFMKSDFGVADLFDMLPFEAWVSFCIICISLLVSTKFLPNNVKPFFLSVMFILIFFSLFTFSQYPALSDRDYFLHGRLAKSIMTKGNVEVRSGDQYLYYPGAFIFWASISMVSGLDILKMAILLSFMFQIFAVFFLFLLFKKSLGFFLSGLATTFFVLSNLSYTRFTIDHFCPQLFALALFLLALHIFIEMHGPKKTKIFVLAILLTGVLMFSHPITALFLVFSITGVYIITKFREYSMKDSFSSFPSFGVFFFVVLICIVWVLYGATPFFQESIQYLLEIGTKNEVSTEFTLISFTSLKHFNIQILLYVLSLYWKLFDLILFIGAVCVTIYGFRKSNRMILFMGGVLAGIIACGAIFSLTRIFWIDRIIFFILIPTCYLFTKFIAKISIRPRVITFIIPLLILLMIPSFLTIYSFTSQYQYFQHPWEFSSCIFLSEYNINQQFVSSDYGTMIIYSFYDPLSWPLGIVGDEEIYNYSLPINEQHPLLKGRYFIRSLRQEITYNNIFNESSHERSFKYWYTFDFFIAQYPNNIRFYDNYYVQIYQQSN